MPIDYKNMTQKDAARVSDQKTRRFRELQKLGYLPNQQGGRGLDVEAVVHGYVAYLRANPTESEFGGEATSTSEKIALEKLQKLRTENARARRELVPVSVLEHYAEQVGSVVHEGLTALAGNIKKRIPHLRAAEITQIKREIVKISNGIAEFDVEHPRGR
jgi:phage terminase Nu1 subunit (DNA packaging protein)